jgi:hypothetical protein
MYKAYDDWIVERDLKRYFELYNKSVFIMIVRLWEARK